MAVIAIAVARQAGLLHHLKIGKKKPGIKPGKL